VRIEEIRQLLVKARLQKDFVCTLRAGYDLELVFHSADNKAPYGYTIIDHTTKSVFKGGDVMPLKQLLSDSHDEITKQPVQDFEDTAASVYVGPVRISDDIDDEAIHGRNRRRKKKARTNTR
jgi:hypothetical protein